jgi:hypothetical protein
MSEPPSDATPALGNSKPLSAMVSQFVKYADVLVGVAYTQGLLYAYLLGNSHDGRREAILQAGFTVVVVIFLAGALFVAGVKWCARQEIHLRKKASHPPDVIRTARRTGIMRIAALILIHIGLAVATMCQPDFHWPNRDAGAATTTRPAPVKISGEVHVTGEIRSQD